MVPSDEVRHTQPIAATASVGGSVTGKALKEALRGLLDDVQARVHILGEELTTKIANDIKVAIAQLDDVLGERITKPINELNETMRSVADRATVIMIQTRTAMDALSKCAGTDAQMIVQGASATINSVGGDITFWKKNTPFVGISYALGHQSRMGMYENREPTPFRLIGSYPGLAPQQCGMPEVTIETGNPIPVSVVSADHRSVVVMYPTMTKRGIWPVTVSYRRTGFLGGCKSKKTVVKSFLVVAPAPEFHVEYSARANCGVYQRSTKKTNRWIANKKCNGDKHGNLVLCPDAGWEYDSSSVRWHGCNHDHSHRYWRDGRCARATWTVPERGGFLCTGGGKSGGAELFLTQRRMVPTLAGSPIKGKSSYPAFYNSSVRLAVFDPVKPAPVDGSVQQPWECQWTVGASVQRPDGTRTDIPPKTGVGALTSASPDGIGFEWNPMDGSMTVTMPPYSCEFLQ